MIHPDAVLRQLEEDPVEGKRLGRHYHADPRSRSFAIEAAPLSALTSVRHKRLVDPYDQGNTGSCTGNACAGVLSTQPFYHHYHEATARRLYSLATTLDPWPGVWPPSDTGSDGLSVAKAAAQRRLITRYEHAFTLDAALTAIQDRAVMLGMSWRTGCDNPDADGLIRWTGSVRGGHEVCVDELDVEGRRVGICNSWGPDWGQGGRCYLGWDDLGQILADQGDVTVMYA